jgi:hypothetical protein
VGRRDEPDGKKGKSKVKGQKSKGKSASGTSLDLHRKEVLDKVGSSCLSLADL